MVLIFGTPPHICCTYIDEDCNDMKDTPLTKYLKNAERGSNILRIVPGVWCVLLCLIFAVHILTKIVMI